MRATGPGYFGVTIPAERMRAPGVSFFIEATTCLLYTSDAADERSSVDLGGRRIIKKKNKSEYRLLTSTAEKQKLNIRVSHHTQSE